MWGTEQFWGTIDFNSICFFLLWKSMVPKTFFKISSFVFSRTKKFIQVWKYSRVSKWWQNFHFCVNYPFNRAALSHGCVYRRSRSCWWMFLVYTQHSVQTVWAVDNAPWQKGCRSPWLWWAPWRTSGQRHQRCCVLDLWIWWGRSLAPPLTEPPDCSCNTASQKHW